MNYNNENTLKDYALWYYFRYYPSNARLEQKLLEKSENKELVKRVIDSIFHLLLEEKILPAKIDNYIYRNKNYRYIEQKMREKLFPMEKVAEHLEKYRSTGESLLKDDFLGRKINIFKQKGKSNTYIMNKLGETKLDREKLEKMLEGYSDNDALKKELDKLLSRSTKINLDSYAGKQKIVEKLIRKGFKYGDIKKYLDEYGQN